jgi:hypothetical protein
MRIKGGASALLPVFCWGGAGAPGTGVIVARVKTTVFSEPELNRLESWTVRAPAAIDIHKPSKCFGDYHALGYYKHLNNRSRWRLRKAIDQALRSAVRLHNRRLEAFGRCAVLRTSQWALDGRSKLPTIAEFRDFLQQTAVEMAEGARELRDTVNATVIVQESKLLPARLPASMRMGDSASAGHQSSLSHLRLILACTCSIIAGKLIGERKHPCRS